MSERPLLEDAGESAIHASFNQVLAPPLSPFFIDFIAKWLDGSTYSSQRWVDQTLESLNSNKEVRRIANMRLERLLTSEIAQAAIRKVYWWYCELLTGGAALHKLHERFTFVAVVGIPRNGGSYLTAELFSALGYEPTAVPAIIAHDGFPESAPFSFSATDNSWIQSMSSLAEYITILDLYFDRKSGKKIFVPKKLTKAVYSGRLFNLFLGNDAEFIITVRHPVACCISTYELSGGLPLNGQFTVRSTIEKWIRRDNLQTGLKQEELNCGGYFTAYLRYWEQFHINIAMSGLVAHRNYKIVPYGTQSMEQTASTYHHRFGSERHPSKFISSNSLRQRHPDWILRAEDALRRVESVWNLVGMTFPIEEVRECI